jgi:hypothetical protein
VICESLDELVELIRDYRARIIASAEAMTSDSTGYPDASATHPSGHARIRVLSAAVSPGQTPVVPIRRTDS